VVRASAPLLVRFLDGFDDTTRVAQAPGLPNHVAWTLGHCALTMHRAAEEFDGLGLPGADFVTGDGTAGDARRYDTESVCYASTPLPDAGRYPLLGRGVEIFLAAADRFGAALAGAGDETFAGSFGWGRATLSAEAFVTRIVAHNGTHTGQIIDIRRALGMARVIG
jgi:hypothetical protein